MTLTTESQNLLVETLLQMTEAQSREITRLKAELATAHEAASFDIRARQQAGDARAALAELADRLQQAYAYADQIAAESCGFAFDAGLAWTGEMRRVELEVFYTLY
jgi:predicted RNase H-like nuclease (RuvC/YqgF family)